MKNALVLLSVITLFASCNKRTSLSGADSSGNKTSESLSCMAKAERQGFIKTSEHGKLLLYGGNGKTERDFDISGWLLKPCQLKYGLGRESFDALIHPEFITVREAGEFFPDRERFLVATSPTEVKAYSISLLTRHEVVNDVINGRPIMAAYCVLADLGAIYSREYCNKVFTFGLSGYTYSDPQVWGGTDAFVLWDRETESLWWPLIDKAVSGDMQEVALEKYSGIWFETTLDVIKKKYPEALVLKPGQSLNPPTSWRRFRRPCK